MNKQKTKFYGFTLPDGIKLPTTEDFLEMLEMGELQAAELQKEFALANRNPYKVYDRSPITEDDVNNNPVLQALIRAYDTTLPRF